MMITGPGKNVKIEGKLLPCKRKLSEGPWTMVRECDTMIEGLSDDKDQKSKGQSDSSGVDSREELEEVPATQPLDTELDGDSLLLTG